MEEYIANLMDWMFKNRMIAYVASIVMMMSVILGYDLRQYMAGYYLSQFIGLFIFTMSSITVLFRTVVVTKDSVVMFRSNDETLK